MKNRHPVHVNKLRRELPRQQGVSFQMGKIAHHWAAGPPSEGEGVARELGLARVTWLQVAQGILVVNGMDLEEGGEEPA